MDGRKEKERHGGILDRRKYIGQRKNYLTHQLSEGKFHEEGRKDILVVALGKSEHPGRVRGVGQGVGIKVYFVSSLKSSPSRGSGISQEDMQMAIQSTIQSAVQSTVQQAIVKTRKKIVEMMLSTWRSMGGPTQFIDNVQQLLKHVDIPTSPLKWCHNQVVRKLVVITIQLRMKINNVPYISRMKKGVRWHMEWSRHPESCMA